MKKIKIRKAKYLDKIKVLNFLRDNINSNEDLNREIFEHNILDSKNNYGYFFTSGPNTWHGMEKKEIKKERRCLQINYVSFETDWKVKT